MSSSDVPGSGRNDTKSPLSHDGSQSGSTSGSAPSGKFQLPAWAKLVAFLAVVALASVGYFRSDFFHPSTPATTLPSSDFDPEEIAKRPMVPDVILTDASGQQKSLSAYRGNVVILSFWASWCAPCLEELSTFARLEERLGAKGLLVIPVNTEEGDDGRAFAKNFWAAQKFRFPSYFDISKEVAQKFEVNMLPSNFVIDRAGRLVFSSVGSTDWNDPSMLETIESVLGEPTDASKTAAATGG